MGRRAKIAFVCPICPSDEFRERAWQVIEPHHQAQLAALADEFAVAKSTGLGSDDLAQVARAAAVGRVATLLIEDDRQIAGRLDSARIGSNSLT